MICLPPFPTPLSISFLQTHKFDKDDLTLAAAFALGDAEVVDRVALSFGWPNRLRSKSWGLA